MLLEDEISIRSFVRINLQRHGYEVLEAGQGEEALEIARQEPGLELAILDVMLPTISGITVCQTLRKQFPRMGIILLTAKGQEQDKVEGLYAGADDYLVKPFSPLELVARLHALARRIRLHEVEAEPAHTPLDLISPPFRLSLEQRKFFKEQKEISLTPNEFSILRLFLEHPNEALSRDMILNQVWGRFFVGDLKTVDVNIRRLRQKIEDDPSVPQYIETIWGHGYRWRRACQD